MLHKAVPPFSIPLPEIWVSSAFSSLRVQPCIIVNINHAVDFNFNGNYTELFSDTKLKYQNNGSCHSPLPKGPDMIKDTPHIPPSSFKAPKHTLPRLQEYLTFRIRLENFYMKQSILLHLLAMKQICFLLVVATLQPLPLWSARDNLKTKVMTMPCTMTVGTNEIRLSHSEHSMLWKAVLWIQSQIKDFERAFTLFTSHFQWFSNITRTGVSLANGVNAIS